MKSTIYLVLRLSFLACIFSFFTSVLSAQMWNGVDTLYGNEWVDYSKPHFKIKSAESGVHRITATTLTDGGFPLSTVPAEDLRLFKNGVEIPIYISTSGTLSASDFIEFIGKKNTSEVDQFLFDDPDEEMANPWYSMFTDTAAYFLTYRTGGQGKRYASVVNDLSNVPGKEEFCWYESMFFFSNIAVKRTRGTYISNSWFDGDGFAAGLSHNRAFNVTSPKIYTAGPDATFQIRYFADSGGHDIQTSINDSIQATQEFFGFKISDSTYTIPATLLKGTNSIRLQELNTTDNLRFNAIGANLRYPRLFDFLNVPNTSFFLPASTSGSYVELSKIDAQANISPIVFDETNQLRLEAIVENNLVKFFLPPSAIERKISISNGANGHFTVTNIQQKTFRDFSQESHNFIFITTPSLRAGANGTDPVQDYVQYRQSPAGGNYNPILVEDTDLYDQFAFGLDFHSISIRNFLHFAKKQWPTTHHVLILGKGLEYDVFRSNAQKTSLRDSLFFVPTIGKPGSDWVFVMPNRLQKPIMSIGRIAARRPVEIEYYLDKIIEQEANLKAAQTVADKAWMKRVLHISGGITPNEQASLKNGLFQMEQELRRNRVGAEVIALDKTSNDPVLLSGSSRIKAITQEGVGFLSMFGHGSVNVLDYDFGKAADYTNKGKYPFFMGMGCYSGNCHTAVTSVGEDFTLVKDKGSISFFATSNPGYVHALNNFGNRFYKTMGGDAYGKTVGELITSTMDSLTNTTDPATVALLHQMVLQGDPSYRLNFQYGADYTIDPSTFSVNPSLASAELDSVTVHFDLYNLGEHKTTPLEVRIQQEFPNDSIKTLSILEIPAPAFKSELKVVLPPPGSEANGQNRLFIQIDPENKLVETPSLAAEQNNEYEDGTGQKGANLFYFLDDVLPLYPSNFSIVNIPDFELIATSYAPKTNNKRFLFEIDTTNSFNSPWKKDTAYFQEGGLLSWKPTFAKENNRVYYWRISADSLSNGQLPWRSSSFMYKNNSDKGWNQSHYDQYKENIGFNIELNPDTHKFEFVDNGAYSLTQVGYFTITNRIGFYNNWFEGYVGRWQWWVRGIRRGILVSLTNPIDGHFVQNPPGAPYNFDTEDSTRSNIYFYFDTQDSLSRINLMNFLENEIPDDYIVSFLTYVQPTEPNALGTPDWASDSISFGKNLYQVLESKGAQNIRQLETLGSIPYGLVYHNNNPDYEPIEAIVATNVDTTVEIRANYLSKWSAGFLQSPNIGPVKSWNRLEWNIDPLDDPTEEANLQLFSVRDGKADTLVATLTSQNTSYDLSAFPVEDFPYFYLKINAIDTTLRTSPQLNFLRIYYEGLAEGSVDLRQSFVLMADTLQQGEKASMSFTYKNVSEVAMDSILILLNVTNDNNKNQTIQKRFGGLAPFESLQANFEWETLPSSGEHTITAEVNPNQDQTERYHFNNFIYASNWIEPDGTNPLLDVTFDGIKILNEDIVSPLPLIFMSLEDENPYFLLQDTSTFSIKITSPSGIVTNYTTSSPELVFRPAEVGKNKAEVELRPQFTEDGLYTMHVNGQDGSGNKAGNTDYSVKFQVITTSSLSNLVNYPNPFSTSTCFYYTMTGYEQPSQFKMQIMTVSGRVVREILQNEFGPLLPGTRKSEFCWDGKDNFGDQLANGVYLYRVFAKKADGTDFELFENEKTTSYFKNGIGKMVLMR